MADTRSIIVDITTQNGIKKQKSFTDVDPEATAVEMLNFANAAVALTTDTFRAASYVDKEYLAGGSIMKEQLTTGGSYSITVNYPTTSTIGGYDIQVKHADGNKLTVDELCTLNITIKTYETDVYARLYANNILNTLFVGIYPSTSIGGEEGQQCGINQSTTPVKPFSTTKGAGRIEVTIHDGATYKGFTYTINVVKKA